MTFERVVRVGSVLVCVLATGCMNRVGQDDPKADPIVVPGTGGAVPFAGELDGRIVDYPDGSHEQRYHLRASDGRARRLHFASAPGLSPGARLQGWGRPAADGFGLQV